jgi:hypothetical protein
MNFGVVHDRGGANARRQTKQSHGNSTSPDVHHEHSSTHQQTQGPQVQSTSKQALQPVRPTLTWAEAIGHAPDKHQAVQYKNPTYHTIAQDVGFPFLLEHIPHIKLTDKYYGSFLLHNELIVRHFYPAGKAATRELLQSCRTDVHNAILKRPGTNLMHTDIHGDTITNVTKKSENSKERGSSPGT